jgi:hypothetical protein
MPSMSLAHLVSCPVEAYASKLRPVRGYGDMTKVSSMATAYQKEAPPTASIYCMTSSAASEDRPCG